MDFHTFAYRHGQNQNIVFLLDEKRLGDTSAGGVQKYLLGIVISGKFLRKVGQLSIIWAESN